MIIEIWNNPITVKWSIQSSTDDSILCLILEIRWQCTTIRVDHDIYT